MDQTPTTRMESYMINWTTTNQDRQLIKAVAGRAKELLPDADIVDLKMDVTACHLNGTPLNLKRLLGFDDFNFLHDIVGIARHIDRNTGVITNQFLPRSSK